MIFWWLTSLIIKLALVSLSPLTLDENYYWVWSQNLQLSYYDHPAMVAWLFAIGNFLPVFMLKWPAVLLGHSFFLVWDQFIKKIGFSLTQRKTFFLLAMVSPVVGMTTLVLTPDLPLLFFLSLSVYTFERALTLKTFTWYSLFGLSLGLGFTSKYHIVLIIPGILLYLFVDKKWSQISWRGVFLSVLGFLIGASPVLIWNSQNEWISFKFQIEHGIGSQQFNNAWPIEFILSQLMILTPLFITELFKKNVTMNTALPLVDHKTIVNDNHSKAANGNLTGTDKLISEANKNNKEILTGSDILNPTWLRFCWLIFLPIMAFFVLNSFKHKVEANWTQIAFPFILSFLASKSLSKKKIGFYLVFWLTLLSILLSQWRFNWWKNPPSERLTEPFRYSAVLPEVDQYKPFYASTYQMASYLWFQTRKPTFKLYQTSRIDFFDYFPQAKPIESVFYIAKPKDTEFPEWFLKLNYKVTVAKQLDREMQILRVSR